jgi:putative redox protein
MATFTATAHRLGTTLVHEVDVNGRHTILTDEPESLGGSDLAPTPQELLPAALAACISTTIELYVRRKEWSIGEVPVDVSYDTEAEPRHFAVTVELPEGLSDDQIARITRIAQRCPVSRAFQTGFTIEERVEARVPVA